MNEPHAPLNMDRSLRVVIETAGMDWERSPAAGVWRKKLERAGSESGLVTSVVRYEPGSTFAEHAHPLGEEIFVLAGVFADEHGEYPAGTWIRSPHGSMHAPFTRSDGALVYVKVGHLPGQ